MSMLSRNKSNLMNDNAEKDDIETMITETKHNDSIIRYLHGSPLPFEPSEIRFNNAQYCCWARHPITQRWWYKYLGDNKSWVESNQTCDRSKL